MPPTERTPSTESPLIDRLKAVTETLELIAADRATLALLSEDEQRRLRDAVAQVWNPDMRARRALTKALARRRKRERSQRDERVLAATGIRELRRQPVFTTPRVFAPKAFQTEPAETADPRNCYICKKGYSTVHHFYDRLCVSCGDLNFAKRTELADLRGRVALLTGGRVKIGYQAGLKLLRSGVHLIVTTRFPRDSASRYAQEPDFDEWSDRLEIFGLDLRHAPSVEAFCRGLLSTRDRLDVHHQQRLSDGPASARLLYAHDRRRNSVAPECQASSPEPARCLRRKCRARVSDDRRRR